MLVGCYNHLRTTPGDPHAFPLSKHFRERGVALSSTALMAACQNVSCWSSLSSPFSSSSAKATPDRAQAHKRCVAAPSHQFALVSSDLALLLPILARITAASSPHSYNTVSSHPSPLSSR